MTEDEMVGWYHRPDGHEFEQAPGVGDGQGSLACCSPGDHRESDTTEQLNFELNNKMTWPHHFLFCFSEVPVHNELARIKRIPLLPQVF